jgi:hypothetical protein
MKTMRAAAGAVTRPSAFKEMVLEPDFSFPWQAGGGGGQQELGNTRPAAWLARREMRKATGGRDAEYKPVGLV